MANPQKDAVIAELAGRFRDSNAAVLTEYRGLSVTQMEQLRSTLREDATYAVVKNTLTARAASEAGVDAFDGLLEGPTAIAFVSGDPVTVAKGLRDFAKDNQALVIKAGLVDGKAMSADDMNKLASLESREALLAKLAGALQAPMANAAALFNAAPTKTARLVDALRQKVQEQGPASGADSQDEGSSTTDEAPASTDQAPEATADVAEGGDEN